MQAHGKHDLSTVLTGAGKNDYSCVVINRIISCLVIIFQLRLGVLIEAGSQEKMHFQFVGIGILVSLQSYVPLRTLFVWHCIILSCVIGYG